MLAAKLISSKAFVIPRRDFSTSSAFDMYRHDVGGVSTGNYGTTKTTSSSGATNLFDSTFYFKTSAHNVYKVLYNGDQLQTGVVIYLVQNQHQQIKHLSGKTTIIT